MTCDWQRRVTRARWIHWLAATQDIVDTGTSVKAMQGLGLLESQFIAVINDVRSL